LHDGAPPPPQKWQDYQEDEEKREIWVQTQALGKGEDLC
jgi:hypothetical protein